MISFQSIIADSDFEAKTELVWSDKNRIMPLIISMLSPRTNLGLTKSQMCAISTDIMYAFASTSCTSFSNIEPYICIETAISVHKLSFSLRDAVLLNIYRANRCILKKQACRVVLVENNIELPEFYRGIRFEVSDTGSILIEEAEKQHFACIVDFCVNNGVGALFCQRRIHPFLVQVLEERGVLAVPHVSGRYMSLLSRLTGAALLGELSCTVSSDTSGLIKLPTEQLGCVSQIEWRCYGKTDFLFVSACKAMNDESTAAGNRDSVTTVLLCGPTTDYCTELSLTCRQIVKVLSLSLSSPWVLKGAGCWQGVVGRKMLSQSVSVMPKTHISRSNPVEFLAEALLLLHEKLSKGVLNYDFHPVDAYLPSKSAVEIAVEACCTVMSCDGVVLSR